MGTSITFKRHDGKETAGYLAKPGRDHAPGIIVIQEWWGLQDQIKGICDRLARAGYEALAPDLYAGTTVPYHDTERANHEMASLDFLDATDNIVRGAAQYLSRSGAKVGLTGFCLGGAVTILGAVRLREIAAACCFYGIPPRAAAHPEDIRIPFQGHFASRDDWCTPELVANLSQSLASVRPAAEIFSYDADHAFMNEQRGVHDRAAAELAWKRMLAFWKTHLGS
ncbi:MAG: dienelactone hydrolase family protein [Rhizobiales bacterium]|nr:dienelactone hydrolase family protein [Hyphomicrobiales bacterium]